MKTCAGYDSSAPKDVLQAIKIHLKKTQPGRTHLDKEGCCMMQDTNGEACSDSKCKYDGKDKRDFPERPKDEL